MAEIKIPNNSIASNKNGATPEKKFSKVTHSKVSVKKKSTSKKLADIFIAGDIEQVKHSLVNDMLIPAAKNLVSSMVSTAINMLLFNNRGPVNNGYYQPGTYYQPPRYSQPSYSAYYSQNNQYQQPPAPGYSQSQEVTFASRVDAEEVLSQMNGALATYSQVSVADFYDLVGITTNYTDYSYGWYNLNGTTINPVPGGFVIHFPKAIALRR